MAAVRASGGIQGQTLEITVLSCKRLRETEWISKQDPYVCLEYGPKHFRTQNAGFDDKFSLSLTEGLREISVSVWNSNTLRRDSLIGKGIIQLKKVLSEGYDDSSWSLNCKQARYVGEVRVIMEYPNAKRATNVGGGYPEQPYPPPLGCPPFTAAHYTEQPYPLPPGPDYPTFS